MAQVGGRVRPVPRARGSQRAPEHGGSVHVGLLWVIPNGYQCWKGPVPISAEVPCYLTRFIDSLTKYPLYIYSFPHGFVWKWDPSKLHGWHQHNVKGLHLDFQACPIHDTLQCISTPPYHVDFGIKEICAKAWQEVAYMQCYTGHFILLEEVLYFGDF